MSDVEREITVPVDPERAWRLVTEPEHLEQWLAPEVEIDPRPGGPVRVVESDETERRGVVEVVDAPRRLRFIWRVEPDGEPTTVEITVAPDDGGSRIEVVEQELERIDAVGTVTADFGARREPLLLAA
ncbi:MAG: hypothetical protein QOJ13_496 [Gaiellales bacterium]|jgi:uncharacterized protein YndB with AHSA1/START domain|nr:hypothetical protein [Gaiellales bacterium]MDX6591300.1 hypothetical protein [Gaiellales bacterium]